MWKGICNDSLINFTAPMSLDNFNILNPIEVNEKCQLRQDNYFVIKVTFQLELCFNTSQLKVFC